MFERCVFILIFQLFVCNFPTKCTFLKRTLVLPTRGQVKRALFLSYKLLKSENNSGTPCKAKVIISSEMTLAQDLWEDSNGSQWKHNFLKKVACRPLHHSVKIIVEVMNACLMKQNSLGCQAWKRQIGSKKLF